MKTWIINLVNENQRKISDSRILLYNHILFNVESEFLLKSKQVVWHMIKVELTISRGLEFVPPLPTLTTAWSNYSGKCII